MNDSTAEDWSRGPDTVDPARGHCVTVLWSIIVFIEVCLLITIAFDSVWTTLANILKQSHDTPVCCCSFPPLFSKYGVWDKSHQLHICMPLLLLASSLLHRPCAVNSDGHLSFCIGIEMRKIQVTKSNKFWRISPFPNWQVRYLQSKTFEEFGFWGKRNTTAPAK